MLTKDAAICIRALDYSETSQILTLFTRRSGKISAIAKGSKRPKSAFDGPVEILSFGEIVFSHRTDQKLATLTEFQQQPAFTPRYASRDEFTLSEVLSLSKGGVEGRYETSLFALNCSYFAAELLNHLTDEYDPHPELFDNFLQFLQNTNEIRFTPVLSVVEGLHACPERGRRASRDTLMLLILFQLALLKEVGLKPVLKTCVNCKTMLGTRDEGRGTSDELYFSSSANGLICRDCEANFPDRIRLTGAAANCLSSLKLLADASEETLKEIEKVLISHFTNTLGRRPKMAKYILQN